MIDWKKRARALKRPKQSEVVLTFVGDIFPRPFSKCVEESFKALINVIRDSDLAFANLEKPFTTSDTPDLDYPVNIKADPSLVDELVWAGFDVVSLANNHMMNYGPEGLIETMQTLTSRGIKFAGGGMNIEEALAPAYARVKDVKISFLSFNSHNLAAFDVAGAKRPGLAYVRAFDVMLRSPDGSSRTTVAPLAWDIQSMEEAIGVAKGNSDFVIVALHFHWVCDSRDVKDVIEPNLDLVTHAAVDAGSDLVIGHGPHILRGIEAYKGKYIFNSLGNFVIQSNDHSRLARTIRMVHPKREFQLGPRTEANLTSIVPRVIISKSGITGLELLPIKIVSSGENEGIPLLADSEESTKIIDYMISLSPTVKISCERWFGEVRV